MIGSRATLACGSASSAAWAWPRPRRRRSFRRGPVKIVMGFGAGGLGDIAGRAIGAGDVEIDRPAGHDREHAGRGRGDRGARASRARRRTAIPCSGSAARTPSRRRCSRRCLTTGRATSRRSARWRRSTSCCSCTRTARSRPSRDVIEAAKKNPDKFNFGSIAVGTAQNLSTLNFVSMAGLKRADGAVPHHRRGRRPG